MTDSTSLVAERVEKLLAELDPAHHRPGGVPGAPVRPRAGLGPLPRGLGRPRAAAGAPAGGRRPAPRRRRHAPGPRHFFGLAMAGPTVVTHGDDASGHRLLRRMFTGEDAWCQLFSEPGAGSDLAGPGHPGRARRRRVGHHRPEGLEHARPHRRPRHARRPHRPRGPQAQGPHLLRPRHARPRRRGPAAAPDHRRGRVQRGLPDRGAGARRRPHRRRRRRLAGVDDHADERADHDRRRGRRAAPGLGRHRRGRPHLEGGGRATRTPPAATG